MPAPSQPGDHVGFPHSAFSVYRYPNHLGSLKVHQQHSDTPGFLIDYASRDHLLKEEKA